MIVYLVDRFAPDFTLEQLTVTERALISMTVRFTANGKPVRYLYSTFIPQEGHCMSLFEARSAKIVQEVNEAAQLPFTRIIEAIELMPAKHL